MKCICSYLLFTGIAKGIMYMLWSSEKNILYIFSVIICISVLLATAENAYQIWKILLVALKNFEF